MVYDIIKLLIIRRKCFEQNLFLSVFNYEKFLKKIFFSVTLNFLYDTIYFVLLFNNFPKICMTLRRS